MRNSNLSNFVLNIIYGRVHRVFWLNELRGFWGQVINPYNDSGFTLVELLVVISILAMVTTLLFPNFMGARQRARDAQRKSDLLQIQKALELYKMDQNPPVYPTTGAFGSSLCNQCWSSNPNCTGNVYMRKFPCDPGSTVPSPYIYTRSSALTYTFSACLENAADTEKDPTTIPACSATNASYTIHEP